MSKKRKRDGTEVDAELVDVYDQLAHEDNTTRLKAAHRLLTKVYRPDTATEDQLKSILTRLFRGLCSGRKAARIGFAVALTELLTQISTKKEEGSIVTLAPAQFLDILESQTSHEGHASGQDERDHYFGRVFGAEAIIKSGILFTTQDRTQWTRLLESICSVAQKKPWLRQECGWVLYQFAASEPTSTKQPFVEEIIKVLNSRKLIRTPEGVGIWLAARTSYPKVDLSKNDWKSKHPLARNNIDSLGEIMKNARSQDVENGHDAQGAATWSASLHFSWTVVLSTLYHEEIKDGVSFQEFWQSVVDRGLFRTSSSPERKLWGMLVWVLVLQEAPLQSISYAFTKNALHCLVTSLHGKDRYLRKTSQNVLQTFQKRLKQASPDELRGVPSACLRSIIVATDFADFDKLTKTNTIGALIENSDAHVRLDIYLTLLLLLESLDHPEAAQKQQQQRYILDLQSKVLAAAFKSDDTQSRTRLARTVLSRWLSDLLHRSKFSTEVHTYLQDRIASALEQALSLGPDGRAIVQEVFLSVDWRISTNESVRKFDEQVQGTIEEAFVMLENLRIKNAVQVESATSITLIEGFILLHCIVLFEVYCGDAEAVEILQDIPNNDMMMLPSNALDEDEIAQLCDSLLEILLSLLSRSSKLLRTAAMQIFEPLAPHISEEGISTLARVLESKENAQGQQDMFEAARDEEEEADDNEDSDDNGELDSDVEMVNGVDKDADSAPKSSSSSSSDSDSDDQKDDTSGAEDAEDDTASQDPELAAFDAALASALGTSKPNPTDPDASSSSDSDSGSDMSDTAMLALDAKLSEVFRARRAANPPNKAKQRRQTKEQLITFKNRVLDLVEIYLKQQTTNALGLGLVLPMLRGMKVTGTKQIADRMYSVLKEYCQRCKGPKIPSAKNTELVLSMLRHVHDEACFESSNAHSSASSQASILLVKVLLNSGGSVGDVVDIYAQTRMRQLTEKTCKVTPGFFTDWGNWCVSAREKLAR